MGREVRKVAKGWEHPRDERGRYHPMFAEPYIDVLQEWQQNNALWEKGIHPDQQQYRGAAACKTYADWNGPAPDPSYYNQHKWTEKEACCFQYYETVTEGTPLSPVFDSLADLSDWLIKNEGYTRAYAEEFCRTGWAPTFIGQVSVDTESILKKEEQMPRTVRPPKKRKGKKPGMRAFPELQ
ncbi:hypothetical protein [Chitinophaga barathri]|uniref:Uncharacterized protein n=1 Tax=Chitinophaga barathri TaxID=1647451 RepID=A0A3N4MG82_9BACT|nr:hypothetical protein [Chitinophaga barathri]RPD42964.1 hypothetical protein EG028_01340 [Chitinophaga barathri]